MSFWNNLFGKKTAKSSGKSKVKSAQGVQADARGAEANAHWNTAIAAAEAGQEAVALQEFQRAIEINPGYFMGTIQPVSGRAIAVWKRAMDAYVAREKAKYESLNIVENHCAVCGRDLGNQWHYMFESLGVRGHVGGCCTNCGMTLCKDHLTLGPDGYIPLPCPKCGGQVERMEEGPADSSMVRQATMERRYHGPIAAPSKLLRPVEQ